MPWYLQLLPQCYTCGKPATRQLVNPVNAPSGVYCAKCGKRALAAAVERYSA